MLCLNRSFALLTSVGAIVWWLSGPLAFGQEYLPAPQSKPATDQPIADPGATHQSDAEILTRGPVHEAFATPIDFDSKSKLISPKAPPNDIEEVAPEQRPGGNAIWIRGYWAWDDERNDFIWVSGTWRIPPEGRRWVDGRWERVANGYQRVPGYWAPEGSERVEYIEEAPPETLEEGPSSPAPGSNYAWIPGAWEWRGDNYVWRPGYWTEAHDNWVWTPGYYRSTPRGYYYINGYWDYPLADRGWLFAPAYFNNYRGYYRPSVVLDTGLLALDLFVGPWRGWYYYGDYYGSPYWRAGYRPWYSYSWGRNYYDPIFGYYNWYFGRRDRDWKDRFDRRYDDLVRNRDRRPPRTWDRDWDRDRRGDRDGWDRDDNRQIARRVEDFSRSRSRERDRSDALDRFVRGSDRDLDRASRDFDGDRQRDLARQDGEDRARDITRQRDNDRQRALQRQGDTDRQRALSELDRARDADRQSPAEQQQRDFVRRGDDRTPDADRRGQSPRSVPEALNNDRDRDRSGERGGVPYEVRRRPTPQESVRQPDARERSMRQFGGQERPNDPDRSIQQRDAQPERSIRAPSGTPERSMRPQRGDSERSIRIPDGGRSERSAMRPPTSGGSERAIRQPSSGGGPERSMRQATPDRGGSRETRGGGPGRSRGSDEGERSADRGRSERRR